MNVRRTITEPYRSIIFLGALILLRAAGQAFLYAQGFLNVSADEFARGIAAARWATLPRFDMFDQAPGAWLPLEKYVNGLALIVWPDVILAPRITVFLSSCLVLIGLYLLVYYLFRNFAVAGLASLFVVFQPWFVWLSGTPMLEMYYLAFYLAGLLCLLVWLRDERRGFWILAGLGFMITSGYHVQSWYLINLVNLLTVPFLILFIRDKQHGRAGRLIGYYFLSNALIFIFVAIEFFHTGEALAFLSSHTSYSRWFYGGYNVDLSEKLTFYPKILIGNVSGAIWGLTIVALVFIRTERDRIWKLFPLILAISAMITISISNVLSGPPSAAPSRYSLLFVLMLTPYIAYGTYRLLLWAKDRPSSVSRYSIAALSVLLFIYSIFWGAVRTYDHPGGHRQAIAVGNYLNELLNQSDPEETQAYMVELKYWEFLAIQLAAKHFDDALVDRVQDLQNRETPSIFEQAPGEFHDILSEQNVWYVALRDPELKAKVQESGFLSAVRDLGSWTIYEFEP